MLTGTKGKADLQQAELLSDAVPRPGGEGEVGERMASPTRLRREAFRTEGLWVVPLRRIAVDHKGKDPDLGALNRWKSEIRQVEVSELPHPPDCKKFENYILTRFYLMNEGQQLTAASIGFSKTRIRLNS